MATNNEKLLGVILGASIGGYIANTRQIKGDYNGNNDIWDIINGVFWGGLGGYSLATFFGSPNDTVNYTHYHKGKRVYEGITYADRFKKRMAEHRRSGKLFTKVVKDKPKPRIEALKLERENIIKYKPSNNIQLNKKRNGKTK